MRRFLMVILCIGLLTGCTNLPSFLTTPQPATATPTELTPTVTPTETPIPPATPGGTRTLRIWVPPQFDPATETEASQMLQTRLDEFVSRRPGLQLDVRVKAVSGPSSLLESLIAASAAAPAAMPDLIALSRVDMEAAAMKGLLHPLDGLTILLENPDWYPFAIQMAHIQNTAFGLPFAADALALVGYTNPLPVNWTELKPEDSFIFPAADQQALFSLAMYLSAGGALVDKNGRPFLDEAILTDVLTFYRRSADTGNLLNTSVNYQTDAQVWQAFQEQRASMSITWATNYINNKPRNVSLAALPGLGDTVTTGPIPISLATGWSWALAGTNSDNQALAVELAEFLSDSLFLTGWTQAAGYLPTRPTALSSWNDAQTRVALGQIANVAQLAPSSDLQATLGPLVEAAVISVLKGEQPPQAAAQSAAGQLK